MKPTTLDKLHAKYIAETDKNMMKFVPGKGWRYTQHYTEWLQKVIISRYENE